MRSFLAPLWQLHLGLQLHPRRRTLEAVDECELAFKDVDAVEMLH